MPISSTGVSKANKSAGILIWILPSQGQNPGSNPGIATKHRGKPLKAKFPILTRRMVGA
jgi:hypothetical protein